MKRSEATLPLLACIASVVACLLYAVARPHLSGWLRDHGGGVPYTVFWILLWLTLIPKRRWLVQICVACVLATCCLEIFQLYRGPTWLQNFRRTTLGAAWLGGGFDWLDFPPYLIGGLVGWILGLGLLNPREKNRPEDSD